MHWCQFDLNIIISCSEFINFNREFHSFKIRTNDEPIYIYHSTFQSFNDSGCELWMKWKEIEKEKVKHKANEETKKKYFFFVCLLNFCFLFMCLCMCVCVFFFFNSEFRVSFFFLFNIFLSSLHFVCISMLCIALHRILQE